MSLTLTLALDVLVLPMDTKGLIILISILKITVSLSTGYTQVYLRTIKEKVNLIIFCKYYGLQPLLKLSTLILESISNCQS